MNNKVQNPKEDVLPNENVFNDEDILNDILISLKQLGTMYGTLKQEASNKSLTNEIDKLGKEVGQMARDSFNLMFEKGWYTLEWEDITKLNEEASKFRQKQTIINE